ncbi:hypothetical protein TKK_0001203 [Trichogramma kaykai]|uniref:tRNA-splicing endonuclease subunit Sen34 n=1 Tax=Trichogramma kaykai TaxID=54128 RepID=A0ABD2WW36_9HYME
MTENKINLVVSGSDVLVWSADEWLELRQKHRIIANCIGSIAKNSRQINVSGLPLLLQPEETKLLLEKNIGHLVSLPILKETPSDSLKKKFENYRNKLYEEQQECLKNQRMTQIVSMMDRIIDGKKRKMLGLNTSKRKRKQSLDDETEKSLESINIDRNALIEEEMAKLPKLDKSDALVQTHTAFPWHSGGIKIEDWSYPNNEEEILRYKVFKDLWEKGFYITSGDKFGCDFLVYPGDPIMFHSQFMIMCRRRDEKMYVTNLIFDMRGGNNVRKTTVYATLSKNGEEVEYFSSRWAGS